MKMAVKVIISALIISSLLLFWSACTNKYREKTDESVCSLLEKGNHRDLAKVIDAQVRLFEANRGVEPYQAQIVQWFEAQPCVRDVRFADENLLSEPPQLALLFTFFNEEKAQDKKVTFIIENNRYKVSFIN